MEHTQEEDTFINENGVQTSNEDILAKLCTDAAVKSVEIRDCLRAYKLQDNTKQLKCNFNQFRKPVIVETLKFLNVTNRNWNNYVKESCVHELICRIQNLLIDKCQFCELNYATGVKEVLLLQCCLCGQNVHDVCLKKLLGEHYSSIMTAEDVKKVMNPLNIKTLNFMCTRCSIDTLPQESDGLKKSITSKSTDLNDLSNDSPSKNTDAGIINSSSLLSDTPQLSGSKKQVHEKDADETAVDKSKLCRFYAKGICKFGKSGEFCNFNHPVYCKPLLNYGLSSEKGCNKGKDCLHFHPKMCHSSLTRHECYKEKCPYFHIKGTRRIRAKSRFSNDRFSQFHTNDYQQNQSYNYEPQQYMDQSRPFTAPSYSNAHHNHNSNDFLSMFHQLRKDLFLALEENMKKATPVNLPLQNIQENQLQLQGSQQMPAPQQIHPPQFIQNPYNSQLSLSQQIMSPQQSYQ